MGRFVSELRMLSANLAISSVAAVWWICDALGYTAADTEADEAEPEGRDARPDGCRPTRCTSDVRGTSESERSGGYSGRESRRSKRGSVGRRSCKRESMAS